MYMTRSKLVQILCSRFFFAKFITFFYLAFEYKYCILHFFNCELCEMVQKVFFSHPTAFYAKVFHTEIFFTRKNKKFKSETSEF
jgi:hypothetical protein